MLAATIRFGIAFSQPSVSTVKPWTYWWWMGSAVSESGIDTQLTRFAATGIGGVHIIPVYGVKGFESQFLPFLSENWMKMAEYTIKRAAELGLGVDMTTGTGWPFGGPWITQKDAAQKADFLHTAGSPTNQKVKRAAPGGEGLVINYFDRNAVSAYLSHFDSVFTATAFPVKPRSWYHDSYEAYQAGWSVQLPERFRQVAGYDFGKAAEIIRDTANPLRPMAVRDYRATISDLLLTEFAKTWCSWCTGHGTLTRYQAHGSPGNLLDLYALASIPETESFGCNDFPIPGIPCDSDYEEERFGRPSPLMMKFASSPANLLGKQLVSAETGTWQANHFKVALSRLKPQVDQLFISGINHIFYHGVTYSPDNEPYPGWLFYASTNFGPSSHFIDELPLLNAYITDCQRILQAATPDQDFLLYFPADELWTLYGGDPLLLLDVHRYQAWFGATSFGSTASRLWDAGYAFDYVSDAQISSLQVRTGGDVCIGDGPGYKAVIIPPLKYINIKTLKKIDSLARAGAIIIFAGNLPAHPAGLHAHLNPPPEWPGLIRSLAVTSTVTADPGEALLSAGVRSEKLRRTGLNFIRKRTPEGSVYFIANSGGGFTCDTISLSTDYRYAEIFDPVSQRRGYIETRDKIPLDLPAGGSCFIFTTMGKPSCPPLQSFRKTDTVGISGPWTVRFTSGNTAGLKQLYHTDHLVSWTEWGDEALLSFCGKGTYSTMFNISGTIGQARCRLALEGVKESASVTVNGVKCGTAWSAPFTVDIPADILQPENHIEITVQNLSANRIRDIDRRGVPWRKFYDINFVDIKYMPFNASTWNDCPSGLTGRVFLMISK